MGAQHTPTPYDLVEIKKDCWRIRQQDALSAPVADLWLNGHDTKLTGEFIVRACNRHDGLLAALKLIVQTCDDFDETEESTNECIAAVEAARALIYETEARS